MTRARSAQRLTKPWLSTTSTLRAKAERPPRRSPPRRRRPRRRHKQGLCLCQCNIRDNISAIFLPLAFTFTTLLHVTLSLSSLLVQSICFRMAQEKFMIPDTTRPTRGYVNSAFLPPLRHLLRLSTVVVPCRFGGSVMRADPSCDMRLQT